MSAEHNIAPSRNRLPPILWAVAWVSFFADLSTELIYGILPAFYLDTLAISIIGIGLIEGLAETLVSLTKLFSGTLSDRTGHRNRWMLAGYSLSTIAKPFLVLATSTPALAALRGADRLGKGIRGAPRDALLAAAVAPEDRGRAFGVNRALDHAGALAGGLIAAALLAAALATPTQLILASVIPGAVAVLIIALFIRDTVPAPSPAEAGDSAVRRHATGALRSAPFSLRAAWRDASPGLKRYLPAAAVFALANSSDILLLAICYERFIEDGVAQPAALGALPLLWALLHIVKSLATTWGGALSDRKGRIPMLRVAWLVYAAVYAGAALLAAGAPHALAWPLFAAYALYAALAEAPERALIADLEPDDRKRGTAFGLLHFVQGIFLLPATALAALLWHTLGPAWAFASGALLALAAVGALNATRPAHANRPNTA